MDASGPTSEEPNNALLIAVVGPTGAGKTTFVNLASDSELRVGHALDSCTAEMQLSRLFTLDGRPVILIDTPGFDDTTKTEVEILQLIAESLVELYTNNKKLSGIIFMHRISDVRMGGIATKNFRLFRNLCGESSLKNVIIATNGWSKVDKEVGEQREQQLMTDGRFFKPAVDKGARLVRHTDSLESAHDIIRQVLHLPPVVLHIQRELVDEGKDLSQTDAGKEINRALEEQAQKHKKEMEELHKQMQNLKDEQEEDLRELREEQAKARKEWEKAQQERDGLMQGEFDKGIREMREAFEKQKGEMEAQIEEAKANPKVVEVHHHHREGCFIQ